MKRSPFSGRFGLTLLMACPLAGCAVGQPPGKGRVMHLQEPLTKGWFYLYLPEGYPESDKAEPPALKWPVVVTFHGMKPFDNAHSQIREWQQEADRYGFIVVAPQCASPDLLKEFPVRTVSPSVQKDEELSIGALDGVMSRFDADPAHVLSTSWSSGGYLAHYMVNRHPDRFSCLAPRQSNFSAAVLDPGQVAKYRNMKVGIFHTENDFDVCKRESLEGARWYNRNGFEVTYAVFKDLGHERRPSVSAAFFAETCGAEAKTPPAELARMQVTRIALPELAARQPASTPLASATTGIAPSGPRPGSTVVAAAGPESTSATRGNPSLTAGVNPDSRLPRARTPQYLQPTPEPTPAPAAPRTRSAAVPIEAQPPMTTTTNATPPRPLPREDVIRTSPLRLRVNSSVGIAPLLVSFNAIVPGALRRGAFFLWTLDGEPISNSLNGQKYISQPGKHRLEVLMTTADGREYRAQKVINVLERMGQ